jgi:signal transduction histidine kinase
MSKISLLTTFKQMRQLFKYRHVNIEELLESNTSMREMLQRRSSLEDIGMLTATIEHEIKNPLAVIESEIYRMKNKFQANPEIMARLERIEAQQMRIYEAANIIVFLRPPQDLSEGRLGKISINDLINGCIKDLKREVNTKDVVFKNETRSIRYFVSAYPAHLQQVIINILKNSVEAIHEAKRKRGIISVETKFDSVATKLLKIEISDNGCGLPDDFDLVPPALFSTKGDRKPNSGLGLFITNRIIEVYGGKLEFESKHGEGTLVRIFLPKAS